MNIWKWVGNLIDILIIKLVISTETGPCNLVIYPHSLSQNKIIANCHDHTVFEIVIKCIRII